MHIYVNTFCVYVTFVHFRPYVKKTRLKRERKKLPLPVDTTFHCSIPGFLLYSHNLWFGILLMCLPPLVNSKPHISSNYFSSIFMHVGNQNIWYIYYTLLCF